MPTGPEDRGSLVGVLAVIDGEPLHGLLAVHEGAHVIGAAPDCDLVLDAPGIAPRHARLVAEQGVFGLQPEDPDALAFVNAEPVEDFCELADGDVVRIATTTLRFRTIPGL